MSKESSEREKLAATVPPKLRGWFHLGATPVVIIASLVLFILSKSSLKFAVALYSISAIMLFSVSAIYHRVPWSPEKKKIWRRWDHANINLLIAGSYTPFAVALLDGNDRTILLSVVWVGALAGVALRIFWINAPRWLYVANYLLLGWVAIVYTPQSIRRRRILGLDPNYYWWPFIFSRSHFLRFEETWAQRQILRFPRVIPYLRARCVDISISRRFICHIPPINHPLLELAPLP
jgi:channel protein (hemolysin III family)